MTRLDRFDDDLDRGTDPGEWDEHDRAEIDAQQRAIDDEQRSELGTLTIEIEVDTSRWDRAVELGRPAVLEPLADFEPPFDPAVSEWVDRALLDLLGRAAALDEHAIAADLRHRSLRRYEIDAQFKRRVDLVTRLLRADRLVDAFDPKWLVVVALGSDEVIRHELDEIAPCSCRSCRKRAGL